MSYGWWSLMIFLTSLVTFGAGVWVGVWAASPPVPAPEPAAPAPRPELPRAGILRLDCLPETGPSGPWLEPEPFDLPDALAAVYGPFPVDTGPLLILSEHDAAKADLNRSTQQAISETDWLIGEAEAKIPPRWR